MECFVWWSDIFIPLISAFIGGGLTLLGVFLTIQHGNRCRNEEREKELKSQAKPILINYAAGRPDSKDAVVFQFSSSGKLESTCTLTGIIKNTDNGIAFVDKIVSGDITYLPIIDSTIDKNVVVRIVVSLADKREKLKGATMFVHDIYGNQYCYDMTYNTGEIRRSEILLGAAYEPKKNEGKRK